MELSDFKGAEISFLGVIQLHALLARTGKWAEIVTRRRTSHPTRPTASLTRNRIPVHSTDAVLRNLATPPSTAFDEAVPVGRRLAAGRIVCNYSGMPADSAITERYGGLLSYEKTLTMPEALRQGQKLKNSAVYVHYCRKVLLSRCCRHR